MAAWVGGMTRESKWVTWIAALIWLTLTAATLPAGSHPALAGDIGGSDDCPVSDRPACPGREGAGVPGSQPRAVWVSATFDVWDGSLARASVDPAPRLPMVCSSTGSGILDGDTRVGCWRSRTEIRGASDPSQHGWMACRYAHAPPVFC